MSASERRGCTKLEKGESLPGGILLTTAPNFVRKPRIMAIPAANKITTGEYIFVTESTIKFSAYVVMG